MKLFAAWLAQAASDLRTAKRVDDVKDPRTFCQAAAKYQQAVEKSVKGLQEILHQGGLIQQPVGKHHPVGKVAAGILHISTTWPKARRHLREAIKLLFSPSVLQRIADLDAVAPQYPKAGSLPSRNTEYPFQDVAGAAWRAPCDNDAFNKGELKRFRLCAYRVHRSAEKIVNALELTHA